MKTCTFTGNRPNKLPWGYDETDSRCLSAVDAITDEVFRAAKEGFSTFVCGMAMGADMLFAEAVLAVKKVYDVSLECAVPYKFQSARWDKKSKKRYSAVLERADIVTVLSNEYTPWCMHARNRYMVDNADRLIALNFADSGGAKYTMDYAKSKGVEIIDLVRKKNFLNIL